jgi:glycosyltransferase involved in cell wall biosynthesis
MVVPNVVDTDHYQPSGAEEPCTVLYQGGMDWYPNRDAVEFFVSAILPRLRASVPEARFVVGGRSPSDEFRRRFAAVPGIEFTGTVPDMRTEIARAAVCVVPLRIGSGTRLKILEAAAMAKPIVSTRVGAEGLDFVGGREIVLADEPKAFAEAVADLLRDASRRRELGRAARRRAQECYSLPVLRTAVSAAFAELSEGRLVHQR